MRWLSILAYVCTASGWSFAADPPAEHIEFFEKKVRPILADQCYSCHGPKKQNAGLRLDTATGMKHGADDGPIVVPGDPAKSRLIASVKRQGDFPMPPKKALPAEAVAVLAEWVRLGAPYPAEMAVKPSADPQKHWAFQPIREPSVPASGHPWVKNPVDAFVLAKLSAAGLSPSPQADQRTLIRRAYYDLIGLPPTAEEVEAFEKDTSPNAYEKVIDRLLASPHYGERWGRYWLDVARYADTKGYVFNEERAFPFAYTYRDYVIRAFNEDKPFDRFIAEQLAADLLPLGDDKRPLAAMGFLTLGRRFLNNTHDIIDDRIDVVTRGFMGLTVQCARCHDHKFDPIPLTDYYSLYGVFASSTEPKELPLIGGVPRTPEAEAFDKEVARREAEYTADLERRHAKQVAEFRSADAVAKYLRAALDARGKPGERVNTLVRERDLNRFVFDRWQAFLTGQLKRHSPVFSPLVALHVIPDADFGMKASAIIESLGKDTNKPVNAAVYRALADAKPKTFADAVNAVAKVFAAAPKEQAELAAVIGPGGPTDIPVADFPRIQTIADRDQLVKIKKKIDAFKASNPAAPPRAHVLSDLPKPVEPVVFLRGNPATRGPAVPRQMPAIASPNRKPFAHGSGRLDLARAIASPDNPLTARVFVNRVWIGHFGQGLVRTPSDFGLRSDPPTHPELLDSLAVRFMHDGWSVKRLHKLIMLSATYQQGSAVSDGVLKADPENKWLAHQNRKRLDFEAMRDSLLVAGGRLDRTIGGRPVDLFKAPFPTRRTVYGLLDRSNFPGTFRSFDVASPDQHSPQRFQTTTPPQALFLLNSPFVAEQAKALAARPEVAAAKSVDAKITKLYRIALSRNPTPAELALGRAFVAGEPGSMAFGPWDRYAQVLLLSNEFAFVD